MKQRHAAKSAKKDKEDSVEKTMEATDATVRAQAAADGASNVTRRVWTTLAMIFGFFALLFIGQHPAILLLIMFVQASIYRELVLIAIRYNEERQLPGFKFFYYYWFFVAVFFLYGRGIMAYISTHEESRPFAWVLDKHVPLSFVLYTIGFVAFVMSLQMKHLKYQFSQFAYCHMALLVVVAQSTSLAANLFSGLLWFVLPCGMVVCNDCFAYIFGKLFGRTPLIALSPKKTWEGFIGGFIATLIWSFWFCRLIQSYEFFVCPRVGFTLGTSCDLLDASDHTLDMYRLHPASVFFNELSIPTDSLPVWLLTWPVSAMQLHSLVMATFASIVAPFGGFFASGFKRAFKIKDFGDSIPGHGGFTDRMDCQIIMGMFSYVYFSYFLGAGSALSAGTAIVPWMVDKLETMPREQQEQVYSALKKLLQQ